MRRLSFLGLVALAVIIGSCGSLANATRGVGHGAASQVTEPEVQYTSFSSARCPKNAESTGPDQEIAQSMNGAIAGCLRIGAMGPGPYSIALEAIGSVKGTVAGGQGLSGPADSAAGPAVQLSLSPDSGPPGSILNVTGTLAAPMSRQVGHADLCWDGCGSGLQYQGVSLTWVDPTKFVSSIVVPAAPWFESGNNKVAPLASGGYKVSIECLTQVKGCGLGGSEGSAYYHLSVSPRSAPWCQNAAECAHLSASPALTYPGDIVKVTGFAPLQSIIGSSRPFVFQLKITSGKASANELTFSPTSKGVSKILMGHAGVTVQPPPAFATLGKVKPAMVEFSGSSQISENPANPGEIAWCDKGQIGVTGTNSNETISTVAAGEELIGMGYGLMGGTVPQCNSVALADGGAAGKIVLASFLVAPNFQAPPFVSIALQTSDLGKHWTPVPVPPGAKIDGFAGFRYQESSLQALFAPGTEESGIYFPDAARVPLLETLKAGDATWQTGGTLACPPRGPCLTFGSYLPGNCAHMPGLQSILYSLDNGGNWHQPTWPAQVQNCSANELVAISSEAELLISSGSPYLIRESSDGGSTWRVLEAPPVPGATPASIANGIGGAELQMLPSGSLLVTGQRTNSYEWDLLPSGSKNWCPVAGLPAGTRSSSKNTTLSVVGNSLYWFAHSGSNSPKLLSISISSLKC